MRGLVANTDQTWFETLQGLPPSQDLEINFWRPSAQNFKALQPSEPLFFRLKAPHNAIGGFGFFQHYSLLPDWLAWDAFGVGNGCQSLQELRQRLGKIRARNNIAGDVAVPIGCILLQHPVFFRRDEWLPVPSDWRGTTVFGKGYDLTKGEGLRLWRACLERVVGSSVGDVVRGEEERWRGAVVRRRLGQKGFRVAVLDAYGRACTVTTEHSLPVVEAAHILPYSQGGEHRVANGLALRADLHRLFDLGYVSVDEDTRLLVSDRLRSEFSNGRTYYEMRGKQLVMPAKGADRPDPKNFEWHREAVFQD